MFVCAECLRSPTLVALIEGIGTSDDCDLCKRKSVLCVRDAQLIPSIKPLLEVYGRPGNRNCLYTDTDRDGPDSLAGILAADGIEIFNGAVSLQARNKLLTACLGLPGIAATDLWSSPMRGGTLFNNWDWDTFEHGIMHRRRFVSDSPVIDLLRDAGESVESFKRKVPIGSVYFRAQLHQNTEQTKALPDGRLGAPPKELATAGRANATGISVLYVAETEETAVSEVRPYTGGFVSVAKCVALNELALFDLTRPFQVKGRDPISPGFAREYRTAILIDRINGAFAEPVSPFVPERDYAPTQYVAELLAAQGFQGIRYKSALSPGYNCVFFTASNFGISYYRTVRVTAIAVSFESHKFYNFGETMQILEEGYDENDPFSSPDSGPEVP